MFAKQQLITIDDISAENAPAIYVSGGLGHFLEAVTSTTAENLIDADFYTAAKTLEPVTTPFEITEKVSSKFRNERLLVIQKDSGEEIIEPLAP